MVCRYPGRRSKKAVADMTPEEYKQHRLHINTYRKNKDTRFRVVVLNPYQYKLHGPRKPKVKAKRVRIRTPAQERARNRKRCSSMADIYVRGLIRKSNPGAIVTEGMIVMYRATLTIKRLIKTMN
jgi:hypothetical protein